MVNVLCVAAHPDDEVLGCGGTLNRHVDVGDNVRVLFVADGVGARATGGIDFDEKALDSRLSMAKNALKCLGIEVFTSLKFPDNQLDVLPLLQITQAIERVITEYKPDIIYTHYIHDLNIDHQITARAVLTACRPVPGFCVKRLLSFEVVSSTEWGLPGNTFTPNVFTDITGTWESKYLALQAYNTEMRKAPHARSFEALEALAVSRGASVGMAKAEAFVLLRDLQRIEKP